MQVTYLNLPKFNLFGEQLNINFPLARYAPWNGMNNPIFHLCYSELYKNYVGTLQCRTKMREFVDFQCLLSLPNPN